MRKAFLLLVLLCVSVDLTNCSNGGSYVLGNVLEPDYKYPWVVEDQGSLTCGGVLIEPRWVLTAAHCHDTFRPVITVSYSRTDPYSGVTYKDSRLSVGSSENLGQHGVHIHPMFRLGEPAHDIALVNLQSPFSNSVFIQTVGLPTSARHQGLTGTVARKSGVQPEGSIAVFRGTIGNDEGPYFIIHSPSPSGAWLCFGDSGSGFVTFEDGRATVRGVVSMGSEMNCETIPVGDVGFPDVFTDLDFILSTMGAASPDSVAGNTRVRWTGSAIRGVMGIGCPNPYDTMWGPLYVVGVQEGANCESGQHQAVVCWLPELSRTGPLGWLFPLAIAGFTMKTTLADGTTSVQSLPFSSTAAVFDDVFPEGATREFTCQIDRSIFGNPAG